MISNFVPNSKSVTFVCKEICVQHIYIYIIYFLKMKLIITELIKSRTQYSFLKRKKKEREMCGDTEKHTDRKRKEMTLFIKRVQAEVLI